MRCRNMRTFRKVGGLLYLAAFAVIVIIAYAER